MELASGRGSKESSSGRGGGGGGSDSGRYSSGSRSEREKGSAGAGRDYAREGGGGRSGGDRERDRDRRGGEKQRRKGDSSSRGGGGSSVSRGYSDRREEKGYRYSGHRDRSSRSPAPDDRNKRPRVSGSPGSDTRSSSGGGRRDGKDKDRQRSRDSDRGRDRDRDRDRDHRERDGGSGDLGRSRLSNGGGEHNSFRSANGSGSSSGVGRRLADLPEEEPTNHGVGGGRNSGDRSAAVNGNGVDAAAADGGDKGTARHMEGVTNGSGAKPPSLVDTGSAGDGEEGEVVLPSSSSSPRASDRDAAAANGGGRGSGGHDSGSVDGGAGSGGGASATRSSSSPRQGGLPSPGGGGGGGEGAEAGDAPNKPAGKDRWADSDSDDEEDGGGKAKGDTAGGGGNAVAPNKSNGAAAAAGGGDGSAHERGGSGGVGDDRGDGGGADGGGGRAGRLDAGGGAGELKLAMAGGRAGGDGSAEDDGGGSLAGGGPVASENGDPGARRRNPTVPMTVFTRHHAAQDTYNPLLYGCRSVENYERIEFIDEGAYGKVYCALNKATGEVVALKQVKLTTNNKKEGFPITALRETNVLLSLHNPNIVRVLEMVVGKTLDKVYMVMEYFDHDLKSVMRHMRHDKRYFTLGQVKSLVLQLLSATEFMHRHWYIHRDLKTSNLLYNHQGKLAVCDFGLARKYEDPIRPYTTPVVTQWYRCPELLLGEKTYSTGVDTWSVGTIFGEIVLGTPMFQGKTEIDQLKLIFGVLGSPTEDRWPGWTKLPGAKSVGWRQGTANQLRATFPTNGFSGKPSISTQGLELMNGLLALDPQQRTSAKDAMEHCWFTTEKPAPTTEMPQVDSKLDDDINKALAKWSKAQIGKQSTRGGISPPPPRQQRPEARPR
eukprot:g3374.t1